MKKEVLTLLGCSGSLGLMLVMGNAANAGTLASQYNGVTAPGTITTHPASQDNSQYSNLDPNSDRVGDMAIAKYGCDCPACRNAVVQMILTGQLRAQ